MNYQKILVDNDKLQTKFEEQQFKIKNLEEKLKVYERDNILIVKNSDEIQTTYEQLKNDNIQLSSQCSNLKKYFDKLTQNYNSYFNSLKSLPTLD
jgi:uncharacterized coiled-coil DUF342 family protein